MTVDTAAMIADAEMKPLNTDLEMKFSRKVRFSRPKTLMATPVEKVSVMASASCCAESASKPVPLSDSVTICPSSRHVTDCGLMATWRDEPKRA